MRSFPFTAIITLLGFALTGCETTAVKAIPFRATSTISGDFREVRELRQVPVLVRPVAPKYPPVFRRAGINGEAQVIYIVDRDGRVTQAEAVAATDEAFAKAAVESVKQWVFRPGLIDGKPVRTRVTQVITFNLN